MLSSKSSLMGILAMASLALAATAQDPVRQAQTTTPPKPRPTPRKYPDDHRAWNEAVDAKRAAKKARKL